MTKKILFLFFALCTTLTNVRAQGWKANYDGVMLQGFYWDSFDDTQWKNLREQADDLAGSFYQGAGEGNQNNGGNQVKQCLEIGDAAAVHNAVPQTSEHAGLL